MDIAQTVYTLECSGILLLSAKIQLRQRPTYEGGLSTKAYIRVVKLHCFTKTLHCIRQRFTCQQAKQESEIVYTRVGDEWVHIDETSIPIRLLLPEPVVFTRARR